MDVQTSTMSETLEITDWDDTTDIDDTGYYDAICGSSLPTPRSRCAASTTLDHTVSVEDLPSPPKVPPSRADDVMSRVDQFNRWMYVTQSLAKDSFIDDTMTSPLRRSALRDVTQSSNTAPGPRKRSLKKQVSFAEEDKSRVFLYTPASNKHFNQTYTLRSQQTSAAQSSSAQSYSAQSPNSASAVVNSPPPYEQIASMIKNKAQLPTRELFFDASSSLKHSIR